MLFTLLFPSAGTASFQIAADPDPPGVKTLDRPKENVRSRLDDPGTPMTLRLTGWASLPVPVDHRIGREYPLKFMKLFGVATAAERVEAIEHFGRREAIAT